ncbi:choice-of-anchor B domain-containing protein [Allocatelliglobosispora scoriae]|uniref:Choice-of-anchor B domain-containing protein n=1 Tax=Allocatelliglobosispora scoriae TaxID=643052 RepID=A0A841BN45_9ACTN|nr:choice-of-anchor B family protein [Allocatelliglobosispora scoriae]MBB5869095.1 choice-of-anchor B domain-containing protein [Allocatelliglobosispora scoriae]
MRLPLRTAAVATGLLALMLTVTTSALAHDPNTAEGREELRRVNADYQPAVRSAPITGLAATSCVGGTAAGYPCSNVDLLSVLPLASIGGGNGNSMWGWTDSATGKEYIIFGRTTGAAFIDVSVPTAPVYLGNLPSYNGTSSSWRDIKVYANHAFIGADSISTHGMQVFDLTRLRTVTTPQTFTADARYTGFGNSHTLSVNEETGFIYAVGTNTCSGGVHMVNVSNPKVPVNAGCVSNDGYVHENQCVVYHGPDTAYSNHEICFNYNTDTLTIVDVTNKSAPVQLSRTGYAGSGYTHQGWLTGDHARLLMDDELDTDLPGTKTFIWNVSDLNAPVNTGVYVSPTSQATDHNLYIIGSKAYQASYRAGFRMFDITNIASSSISEIGYFDIYPAANNTGFNGAWNVYPFFASGTIAISGIEQGLFLVKYNPVVTPPTTTVWSDTFETATGWTVNPSGTDTATTGAWERGDPADTTSSGAKQLGTTVSGSNDLVTGRLAGTAAGDYDLDGGVSSIRSPAVTLPSSGTLKVSLSWYLAHGSNASSADYFRVSVIHSGGTTQLFNQAGAASNRNGAWATGTWDLSAYAGQSVQILIQAADASGASLVEAGVDDVKITKQ